MSMNFSDYPTLDVDFIDADHAEFVALVNRIEAAYGDTASVEALLQKLYHHTVEHFEREEQAMREIRFPPYPVHKAEHDRVLAEMHQVIEDWRKQGDEAQLRAYFGQAIPEWFDLHLNSMDKITAKFIRLAAAR